MLCCCWGFFTRRKARNTKSAGVPETALVDTGICVNGRPRSKRRLAQNNQNTKAMLTDSNHSFENDYRFRMMLVGERGTGKSSLVHRFTTNEVLEQALPTVGCSFCFKSLLANGKNIELQIWDTSGGESCRDLLSHYLRVSACLFLVYSIADASSFGQLASLLSHAKTWNPGVELYLLGMKSDLETDRQVTVEDGQKFARHNGMAFWEVSSLTGHNVQEMFLDASLQILSKIRSEKTVLRVGSVTGVHSYKTKEAAITR